LQEDDAMAPEISLQPENIRALQTIYFASQLDDLKVFQVVDKLQALFSAGVLPVSREKAGDLLHEYWKQSPTWMTGTERRRLYSRVFGLPGGDSAEVTPNREFNDLWLRFISAVASVAKHFADETSVGLCAPVQATDDVRQAAKDLAANLSLHGTGAACFAATELQKHVDTLLTILSHQEIRDAYNARDMWQVVDEVVTAELGGALNIERFRTLATNGAAIISWLAEQSPSLVSSGGILVLECNLINACKKWLDAAAVSGSR
jgi:hypothetical protein